MAVNPIPQGYQSVIPYLIVKGGAEAIEFYKSAFGAEERFRMPSPDGRVAHAELQIGDSVVMLADEFPEMNIRSPKSTGGAGVGMCFYCKDVDAVYHRALRAGATSEGAPTNMFYGDRQAKLLDPFGHKWSVMTHVEDVPPAELERRAKESMTKK